MGKTDGFQPSECGVLKVVPWCHAFGKGHLGATELGQLLGLL